MTEPLQAAPSGGVAALVEVRSLGEELKRSTALKDELLEELARAQGKQREVSGSVTAADDQLKRLDALAKQLDQRHGQLVFKEKKITGFEGKVADLKDLTDEVQRQIKAVAARDAVISAIKKLSLIHI